MAVDSLTADGQFVTTARMLIA